MLKRAGQALHGVDLGATTSSAGNATAKAREGTPLSDKAPLTSPATHHEVE